MECEPHRPDCAELNKAHEEAQQREQQQEAAPEPTRPDRVRTPGRTTDRGDMASRQEEAIERNNEINREWKKLSNDPKYAQQKQQELERQRAAQRGNEGPEHDQTGGRER